MRACVRACVRVYGENRESVETQKYRENGESCRRCHVMDFRDLWAHAAMRARLRVYARMCAWLRAVPWNISEYI